MTAKNRIKLYMVKSLNNGKTDSFTEIRAKQDVAAAKSKWEAAGYKVKVLEN